MPDRGLAPSGTSATTDAAFELEAAILATLNEARGQWVPLAARLHTFHAAKAWEVRGSGTFTEWLAQPEVGISYRTAKDMIDAWDEFVVKRSADPAWLTVTDASKLAVVLPALRRGTVTVGKALGDCETLTRADLRELYRAGVDADLDASTEPERCTCPTCGRSHRRKVVG